MKFITFVVLAVAAVSTHSIAIPDSNKGIDIGHISDRDDEHKVPHSAKGASGSAGGHYLRVRDDGDHSKHGGHPGQPVPKGVPGSGDFNLSVRDSDIHRSHGVNSVRPLPGKGAPPGDAPHVGGRDVIAHGGGGHGHDGSQNKAPAKGVHGSESDLGGRDVTEYGAGGHKHDGGHAIRPPTKDTHQAGRRDANAHPSKDYGDDGQGKNLPFKGAPGGVPALGYRDVTGHSTDGHGRNGGHIARPPAQGASNVGGRDIRAHPVEGHGNGGEHKKGPAKGASDGAIHLDGRDAAAHGEDSQLRGGDRTVRPPAKGPSDLVDRELNVHVGQGYGHTEGHKKPVTKGVLGEGPK